jgi:predicted nucleic acid-binding Zn finger protein
MECNWITREKCFDSHAHMKGLAVANTIGKRNNPDVTIKRYNKLSYNVKSQTSADTWYTVINSYSDGWICDCPDYTFRHTECKHIHSVKFSKLLRKKSIKNL